MVSDILEWERVMWGGIYGELVRTRVRVRALCTLVMCWGVVGMCRALTNPGVCECYLDHRDVRSGVCHVLGCVCGEVLCVWYGAVCV